MGGHVDHKFKLIKKLRFPSFERFDIVKTTVQLEQVISDVTPSE